MYSFISVLAPFLILGGSVGYFKRKKFCSFKSQPFWEVWKGFCVLGKQTGSNKYCYHFTLCKNGWKHGGTRIPYTLFARNLWFMKMLALFMATSFSNCKIVLMWFILAVSLSKMNQSKTGNHMHVFKHYMPMYIRTQDFNWIFQGSASVVAYHYCHCRFTILLSSSFSYFWLWFLYIIYHSL